jgi:predicted transcriptional regulator
MAKIGRYEVEKTVISAMKEIKKPVTVLFIQQKANLTYITAHKVLEEMIKRGSIKKVETTGVSFYILRDWCY